MTHLTPIKPEKLLRLARRLGFELVHVKGSHHIFKNAAGKRISIPVHKGRHIGKGLLLKIIKEDFGLGVEEFYRLI
ncbi:MAG: type II toxin-antitoxin system HicA family toxin [Candidatus Diapherotrites archaeon]|uniref:Type II toxin-antitoxin system HicA family toxin n=1 Tax=Candidatus Iainarchaeum sp. TaxID=3101447 RepID=A0A8T3YMT1_9ARCH|nr:type II toxin-antitoxin system HicA family toxin [Candidatus Diapherotrites archaeon]